MFYEKQGFIFFNIFRRAVPPALAGSVRDAHSFFFLSICLASKHKIIHFFFRNDTLEWFCYCVIWPREPTKLIKSRGVHRGRKCISAQTVSIGISTNKARRHFPLTRSWQHFSLWIKTQCKVWCKYTNLSLKRKDFQWHPTLIKFTFYIDFTIYLTFL